MTTVNPPEDDSTRPSVRDYTLLSVGALLVLLVLLVQQDSGGWGVLVVLIGLVGVGLKWTLTPALVLFVVLMALGLPERLGGRSVFFGQASSPMEDLLLAVTLLVYIAAHTRLSTLLQHAVPPDQRRRRQPRMARVAGRWLLPVESSRRSARTAFVGEFAMLLASAPVFAVVAYLLWVSLAVEPVPPALERLPIEIWRVVLVVWAVLLMLLLATALLAYLRRVLASPQESLLYLQDQLWTQTRGEQRRIWRWLSWARLRRETKEAGK